jgi:translation initiation factor 3 subunit D
MTCTRSAYPWDVVVQKLPNGTLFFDKRDSSQFDFLTVHETAYHPPPPAESDDDINAPERLALEATMINQNFSQQILKRAGRKSMDLPNPFFDEDDHEDSMEPASVAFRYRSFELDPGTTVVCRTELHGIVKGTQYMTAFALNEYAPAPAPGAGPAHPPQNPSWREKIDSQRGAVLATELKNNSFKLAKWTAQSLLAGADQMKIGFVSRSNPRSSYEHVILATQFYRPADFAGQITLREGHMWAMFRYFVHLFQRQPEGKYVLLRDPNHASLRVYRVPPGTFEDDE